MLRLLIVDDERFTVDGLYEMLENVERLELDLYRAYSPEEAMERMARTKIDILLSDIRMPGMTGLELQKRVQAQWPRCKIIFLTGINQLETAQQAIRTGSVDYILKTEGDEAIVRSIREAQARIVEETQSSQFLLEARERISRALPLLHRDWLEETLTGSSRPVSADQLRELRIPLDAELPVILLLGRIDRWEDTGRGDRTLLLYAVQNIVSEYYASLSCFTASLDQHYFVCLLQPRPEAGETDERWLAALAFVQGTMESIQATCERLLRLPLSLICGYAPTEWHRLPRIYERMRKRLVVGLGTSDRMLLLLEEHAEDRGSLTYSGDSGGRLSLRTLAAQLERLLDEDDEQAFAATVRQAAASPASYADYSLVYYTIASLLLARYAQLELSSGSSQGADATSSASDTDAMGQPTGPDGTMPASLSPDALMSLPAFPTREASVAALLQAADVIRAKRQSTQSEQTRQLVARLHSHIHAHLGDDLSLSRLSDVVYLNPAYLSVLYKQQTGTNLSEYIAEARLDKAKALLDGTLLRIHEIAAAVGFETAGYFTRFFKKRLQLTPQEYRARNS
ncbi:response regulator transcription factor [Paenibacillus sp. 598K]|uniref:response regulator transcription factor n=1 Tax=Paenibacillus sp. 598K TaxID=1117987 RepID=UPI000FFEA16F|nr:response regulator [Paenibacillus sp. 598K]